MNQILIDIGNLGIYSHLETMDKTGWIVIDSSNLTIEQTAEAVLQRIAHQICMCRKHNRE